MIKHHLLSLQILNLQKIDGCKNSLENLSTTKLGERIAWDSSVSTIFWFRGIDNKHDVYRGIDCMKTFCKSLREHAKEII